MQTTNDEIKSLVNHIASTANIVFNNRCLAVYVMGSLARGGFSENASDIDLGLILDDQLRNGDELCIEQIQAKAIEKYPKVKNPVSIFWGSIASINGETEAGRYPPFDRLDLIDHAQLLTGKDIRNELKRPSKKELEIAGAEFALDYLGNKDKIEAFFNGEYIVRKGSAQASKTVLFPARFIYLARTGKIAGNDVSYRYYIDHFDGSDAELVKHGYQWRFDSFPDDVSQVVKLLDKGLSKLYQNFIDIYARQMSLHGEEALRKSLIEWKENITR